MFFHSLPYNDSCKLEVEVIIFVVGLPRSGSTLLSKYFNTDNEVISLNDLYFYQFLIANYDKHKKDPSKFHILVTDYLMDFLHERVYVNNEFEGQLLLTADELKNIRDNFLKVNVINGLDSSNYISYYYRLLYEVLGKRTLVDKTPQNFMHIKELSSISLPTKFLYIIREPFGTIKSFKYANFKGHDKRRYHPIIYSMYWNKAFNSYKNNESCAELVTYEQLTNNDPKLNEVWAKLNVNVDSSLIDFKQNNSSKKSNGRMYLTGLESYLIDKLTYSGREEFGYNSQKSKIKFRDLIGFLKVSVIFLKFNLSRIVKNKDARERVKSFILKRK